MWAHRAATALKSLPSHLPGARRDRVCPSESTTPNPLAPAGCRNCCVLSLPGPSATNHSARVPGASHLKLNATPHVQESHPRDRRFEARAA